MSDLLLIEKLIRNIKSYTMPDRQRWDFVEQELKEALAQKDREKGELEHEKKVFEDQLRLAVIDCNKLSNKIQELEAGINSLKEGVIRYPHQVLIPESLFLSQEEKIKDFQAEVLGFKNKMDGLEWENAELRTTRCASCIKEIGDLQALVGVMREALEFITKHGSENSVNWAWEIRAKAEQALSSPHTKQIGRQE